MARGNERRLIYRDDQDRLAFLDLLGKTIERFGWILYTYALMPNHFHLFIQLVDETLSDGMHWLDGTYVGYFNRRHDRVGHLFQGRPRARPVDKDNYFLELLRYIALNPVEAGMVARPENYKWSGHRALSGVEDAPRWLAVDDTLIAFAPRRDVAQHHYRQFVDEGIGRPSIIAALEKEAYLGSDGWMDSLREKIELKPRVADHPLIERRVGHPNITRIVEAVADTLCVSGDEVRTSRQGSGRMVAAWVGFNEGLLRKTEIAAGLRLSCTSVGRLIARCDAELDQNAVLRRCIDETIATLRRGKVNWRA